MMQREMRRDRDQRREQHQSNLQLEGMMVALAAGHGLQDAAKFGLELVKPKPASSDRTIVISDDSSCSSSESGAE